MNTKEEYQKLLLIKNCMICGIFVNGKNFHIDHDHKTGKVRGKLCHKCNLGLGMFKDNIDILKQAIRYLGGI
jgi:hypothetical protein